MTGKRTVWVLWWKWPDNSDSGVSRVYFEKERAAEDIELLNKADSGKTWALDEVEAFV